MSIINLLKCCLKDGRDEKTFIIPPCKTLLANQGYQALSFNFGLYMNDPKENKPMESAEEISKYFDKPCHRSLNYCLCGLIHLILIKIPAFLGIDQCFQKRIVFYQSKFSGFRKYIELFILYLLRIFGRRLVNSLRTILR
jgi:hypothetical protein